MQVEIDQSGKIEETAKRTVIADSLGNFVTIHPKDKRTIQDIYRLAHQPRKFVIHLFSLLVTYLIRTSYHSHTTYIMDQEYTKKDDEIRDLICEFAKRLEIPLRNDQIQFAEIGKASVAHGTAHKAFTTKQAKNLITLAEVLQHLLPQKRTEHM